MQSRDVRRVPHRPRYPGHLARGTRCPVLKESGYTPREASRPQQAVPRPMTSAQRLWCLTQPTTSSTKPPVVSRPG
jgi:hypothetical protein